MSAALEEIVRRHPADRVALVSHLQDEVTRGYFGELVISPSPTLAPKPAAEFEADLRFLGSSVMDPTPAARYFFAAGDRHPALDDPVAEATPAPGLAAWLELMLSDAPSWTSVSD
jgi:hypothetical protein